MEYTDPSTTVSVPRKNSQYVTSHNRANWCVRNFEPPWQCNPVPLRLNVNSKAQSLSLFSLSVSATMTPYTQ